MKPVRIVVMAAVADNGVIGNGTAMPWHLGSDFRRFKQLTMGKPQIMGRKTYESIGRPLPGRTNIIVSRDTGFAAPGCLVAATIDEALALAIADAEEKAVDEVYIQGGGEIYRQAIGKADLLRITHVDAQPEGVVRFPEINPEIWQAGEEISLPAGPQDDFATRYVVYVRKAQ